LTKLDKITFLEKLTDNYHPEKLKLLQEDLRAFIKSTGRQAGTEVELVFAECLYDAFQRTYHDHETLNSVSKDQFFWFLSNHGNILESNKNLLKLAIEIGINKYGESYGHDLAEFIELKGFEKLVNDKVNEIETGQTKVVNTSNKAIKGGRKPIYEVEDTREWFNELSREPDYQHPNGAPNLGAIDAELVKKHKQKTGQKPSFATIKNHRRELGFMQK
jgi:hypothetical protein